MATQQMTFRRPFDTHVHGREGAMLATVAPLVAKQFWGAIFEPNLATPITTAAQARAYKELILQRTHEVNPDFKPYVLLYQTDTLDPSEVAKALDNGDAEGTKFYPKGATTNSESGIRDVSTLWRKGTRQYDVLRAVAAYGKVSQLHCELNYDLEGNELDPYDKEAYFFANIMPRLMDAHPESRWSCEHLTSKEGADFMLTHGGRNLGCSITPHHILFDRRDMFRGGLRPHLFCLPVIKRQTHFEAVHDLARSGLSFVYAGTDSAPHDRRKKECDCCSGGVFSSHAAVELYAMAFGPEVERIFGQFEAFLSINGPDFYNLEPSEERITLRKNEWFVDNFLHYTPDQRDVIRPLGYEKRPEDRMPIAWQFCEQE